MIDYQNLRTKIIRSALTSGFSVSNASQEGSEELLLLRRPSSITTGHIEVYISSGVHGDEPSGIFSILKMLHDQLLCKTVGWTIFPMVCIENLKRNSRYSENGIDPNRDYYRKRLCIVEQHANWLEQENSNYDIAFCLHEDSEASGFYCYEHVRNNASLAGNRILV